MEDPNALLRRGADLVKAGHLEDALALYADLARAHPRSEAPRIAAGNALLGAGRLAEAVREFEAAARLAPKPTRILTSLARLYLDPRVKRPGDALAAARAARRLDPWHEESYYLQARAYEGLGEQDAARRTYETLLQNFPRGRFRGEARRGLAQLSRSHYAVTLNFRFHNRGRDAADQIRFRVQVAQSFEPYSDARLVEVSPDEGEGRKLEDGTRYLSFPPFALAPGEERTFSIRYAIAVTPEAFSGLREHPDSEALERFLAPAPFLESDAPEILSLARQLTPIDGSERERARKFYDFVVKRLSYVVQSETQGALGALAHPTQADCTEFAALFIALSRAAGIPARPVFGYLYEEGKPRYEISHLWAEFWEDGQGWVSADPTNGTLEPERYFARLESNYIPLWVPSPHFGDLAGVRVSYHSPGDDDTLFTELVTDIQRISSTDYAAASAASFSFASADGNDLDTTSAGLPVAPAAALFAAALGLRFWQRRSRPS